MTYRNVCMGVFHRVMQSAILLSSAIVLQPQLATAQQARETTKLTVNDPRPVAKAVEDLVSNYGYVITYEDPRNAYEGDIQDVTTLVRKDLDRFPSDKAPRVIVPRGGTLNLSVPTSKIVSEDDVASILDKLIRAQASRSEGGHFRVVKAGDVFHVVPTEVRDQHGNWVAQSSILDVFISLPMADRDEAEMVDAIARAVGSEAHFKILLGGGLGGGISDPDRPQPYRLGAHDELASSVLMRALVLLNDPKSGRWRPQRLTWQLLYDSSDNAYSLNIGSVPDRSSSAAADVRSKIPTGQSTGGTNVSPPKN